MILIRWMDGIESVYECVCPDAKSAWRVYWALKCSIEKTSPTMNAWLQMSSYGIALDPREGNGCPPMKNPENGGRIILKEGIDG